MSTFTTTDTAIATRGPGRRNRHRRTAEAFGLTPELMSLARDTAHDLIRGDDAHYAYLLAWVRFNPHALIVTDDDGNYGGTYEPWAWAGLHAKSFQTARKYFRIEAEFVTKHWAPAQDRYRDRRRSRRAQFRADA